MFISFSIILDNYLGLYSMYNMVAENFWLSFFSLPCRLFSSTRTTDTWWLDPKFSTTQNHIPKWIRKSCKMYENLVFFQKKWLSNAKSWIRYTLTKYIYYNSKLLVPVVCFAKPVKTSLWTIWAEQTNQMYH